MMTDMLAQFKGVRAGVARPPALPLPGPSPLRLPAARGARGPGGLVVPGGWRPPGRLIPGDPRSLGSSDPGGWLPWSPGTNLARLIDAPGPRSPATQRPRRRPDLGTRRCGERGIQGPGSLDLPAR